MPTTASLPGSEIAGLISQIELTTSNIPQDEELRQKLYDATRKLNLALESPGDTIQRLVHIGSALLCSPSLPFFALLTSCSRPSLLALALRIN